MKEELVKCWERGQVVVQSRQGQVFGTVYDDLHEPSAGHWLNRDHIKRTIPTYSWPSHMEQIRRQRQELQVLTHPTSVHGREAQV